MSGVVWTALLPWMAAAGLALGLLVVIAFVRRHAAAFWVTLAGLAGVVATLPVAAREAPVHLGDVLLIDRFALLYAGLLVAATFAVVLLGKRFWDRRLAEPEAESGELYVLLVTSMLGGMVLVAATHLVTFFLGLETLSVGLYTLIAYRRQGERSTEAGLKYLVLAGASSAFMLFGMALLYAALGTMNLEEMVARTPALGAGGHGLDSVLALGGLALVLVGLGFKLALVPFHLWTPDVYEGAPAPVTAFVATVSKGAVLGLLLRWSATAGAAWSQPLLVMLAPVAVASMLAGNLLALYQGNLKRLLAYSSIAHLGYALVALLALPTAGGVAAEAVTFYLAAYFVTILGAFGIVAALSDTDGEAETIEHVRGLFWRRPWLAALFTAMLLSLAGIPVTAGFVAKFYAAAAAVEGARWVLVLVLVLTSAIGLFYYLRVVVAMFSSAETGEGTAPRRLPAVAPAAGIALVALAVLLVWLGTWPAPVIDWIRGAVAGLL